MSQFSALPLCTHWKLFHKSDESLTPTFSGGTPRDVTHQCGCAYGTTYSVIYTSVEYGQEEAERVHWPSSYRTLWTYIRPFVSLNNYGDLWRTFCSLTQICCSGDNLISWRTSWKHEGHISQIQQHVDSPHNWLSRWPSWFFKKWWGGAKNTDSVNWNSYNGLYFELEFDFDWYHFVLNIAWWRTSKSHIIWGPNAWHCWDSGTVPIRSLFNTEPGQGNISKLARTALRWTQPSIQWVVGTISLEVKRSYHEVNHSTRVHLVPSLRMNWVTPPYLRGEWSYLAPLGSENISAPYFKQCFFRGGVITPQTVKHHASQSQDRNKYFILYIEFCINNKIYNVTFL